MKVKCHINKKYFLFTEQEYGSITLESAVVMSVLTALLLFFISLFQISAAKNILEMSVLRTADEMARWAPIYRNESVKDLSNDLLSEIGGDTADALSEIPLVGNIINLRTIAEYTMDTVYGIAAQTLCSYYIENDSLIENGFVNIEDINLFKSSFYHSDTNQFQIVGECSVKTYIHTQINLSYSVDCAAWGDGRMPTVWIEDEAQDNGSIWSEDNFTRGKILRQMFGANLPDNFPVIAAYENGTAVMIKSLNHTSKSYKDASVFEKTIKEMIDSLAAFNGAEYAGIVIKAEDIQSRRLILIMPENDLSPGQDAALKSLIIYSMSKFVMLDLQRYQMV